MSQQATPQPQPSPQDLETVVVDAVVVPPAEDILTTEYDCDTNTLVETLAKMSQTISQNAKVSNNMQDEFNSVKQFVELNISKLNRMMQVVDETTRKVNDTMESLTIDVRTLQALSLPKEQFEANNNKIWDTLNHCEAFVLSCERSENDAVKRTIRTHVEHFVPRWYEPVAEANWARVTKEIAAAKGQAITSATEEVHYAEEKIARNINDLRYDIDGKLEDAKADTRSNIALVNQAVKDSIGTLEQLLRDVSRHHLDSRQELIDRHSIRMEALEKGQSLLAGSLGAKMVVGDVAVDAALSSSSANGGGSSEEGFSSPLQPQDTQKPSSPTVAQQLAIDSANTAYETTADQVRGQLQDFHVAKQLAAAPHVRVALQFDRERPFDPNEGSGNVFPPSLLEPSSTLTVPEIADPRQRKASTSSKMSNNNDSLRFQQSVSSPKVGSQFASAASSRKASAEMSPTDVALPQVQLRSHTPIVITDEQEPQLSRALLESKPFQAFRQQLNHRQDTGHQRILHQLSEKFKEFLTNLQPTLDDKVGVATLKDLMVKHRDEKLYRNVDKLLTDVDMLTEDKVSQGTFTKQMADKAERGMLDLKVDKVFLEMFSTGMEQKMQSAIADQAHVQNSLVDMENKMARLMEQMEQSGGGSWGVTSGMPAQSFRSVSPTRGAGRAHFNSLQQAGTPRAGVGGESFSSATPVEGHIHASSSSVRPVTADARHDSSSSVPPGQPKSYPVAPSMSDMLFSVSEERFKELKKHNKKGGKPMIEPRPPKAH